VDGRAQASRSDAVLQMAMAGHDEKLGSFQSLKELDAFPVRL
jgi:hypothetical protein